MSDKLLAAILFLSNLLGSLSAQEVAPDPQWTAESIRNAIVRGSSSIRSLLYEADCEGRADLNADDQTRGYHVRVGYEGASRFAEIGHYVRELDWRYDTQWTQNILHNGQLHVVWPLTRKSQRTQVIDFKRNPKVGPFVCEVLNKSTGWWPAGSKPEEAFHTFVLSELLSDSCEITAEELDGIRCAKLIFPNQTCWLDPSRGFALRRRQLRMRNNISAIFENSDFEELADGFWMPRTIATRVVEDSPERQRVFSEETRHVTSYQINVSLAELLEFEPSPGMLMNDMDNQRVWVEPNGEDLLDQLSDYITRFLSSSEPQVQANASFVLAGGYGLSLSLMLLGIALGYGGQRSLRAKDGSNDGEG